MPIRLTPLQRRVLGVLIEKSLSQNESYPLTLNALTSGCNQKSARDPVMSAADGEVARAVWELQQMAVVRQADPGPNTRANRFCHDAETKFGWDARERAIMAELLLRGPQTLGELRGHASRMTPLDNVQYVQELLDDLSRRDPPFVREVPRGPGQSTLRFAHTFYPEDEPLPQVGPSVMTAGSLDAVSPGGGGGLTVRVEALEAAVAALREEVAALRGN